MTNITETISQERWHMSAVKDPDIQALAKGIDIDYLLAKIILTRNIGFRDMDLIKKFIDPPESLVYDTTDLSPEDVLTTACKRVKKALQNNEKIIVNGDPDADGISGATVLVAGLTHLGGDVSYDFPIRAKEGHGIQARILDEGHRNGAKLLITADCGTKDVEAVKYASSLGIDVIITDHHILGKVHPPALAMINPNLINTKNPMRVLSGAGVAFKFILVLFKHLKEDLPRDLEDFMLAVVALGTISDRMSVLEPMNRILIKRGVESLKTTKMKGLIALKKVCLEDDEDLKPRHLSRNIVPRLNAPGRIGDRDQGIPDSCIVVELLTMDMKKVSPGKIKDIVARFSQVLKIDEAQKKASKTEGNEKTNEVAALQKASTVDDINEQRKYITTKIEDEIDHIIKEQINPERDKVVVIQGRNWNSGVIGIDTDRLKERFLRPAIILTHSDDIEYVKGSCRSIPSIDMYSIIDKVSEIFQSQNDRPLFCVEVDTEHGKRTVSSFGGHSQACGFSLHKDDVDTFLTLLRTTVEEIPAEKFHYSYDIIDKVPFEQLSVRLLNKLDKLLPYGQQFDFPIF
ncbi:MAG: single-stranded-DNA-specific exonuclease, partial [Candidatus Marinamargulisbacteria bacterium]